VDRPDGHADRELSGLDGRLQTGLDGAEGDGFEPSRDLRPNGFRDRLENRLFAGILIVVCQCVRQSAGAEERVLLSVQATRLDDNVHLSFFGVRYPVTATREFRAGEHWLTICGRARTRCARHHGGGVVRLGTGSSLNDQQVLAEMS
jgi:hypothetical protein